MSRAPYAKLAAFRDRMGWRFPWYSSYGSAFNYDFHATLNVLNAVCENELSEQAARMVAVEGQLTNIMQLQQKTNSLYNKTRQSSITASLIEILSAMSSLEGNAAKGVKREKFWE